MTCPLLLEEDLNLYLDGELPFGQQQALFAHMTACTSCRETMESVLAFRRMSRQEYLAPPPAADDRFYERLAQMKAAGQGRNRSSDRAPLWQARRVVSVRGAVTAIAAVFVVGLLLPMSSTSARTQVFFETEQVDLTAPVDFAPPSSIRESYTYVFYPGITIEADSLVAEDLVN